MTSPMPLCNQTDIVMHTHPIWAEQCANFVDYAVWTEYSHRYGNTLFGVSGDRWTKIYEVHGNVLLNRTLRTAEGYKSRTAPNLDRPSVVGKAGQP
jgi:hypothetical protein